MAALEDEFTLSSGVLSAGPDGLLGVEQSNKTDQFLVTDRGRTVVLYKVSDQKPLGSWSVKQGQLITCSAVCNFQTGEYVVVHDNKVLRIWNNEDVNLDKVFKATLSAEVHKIHSVRGTEPVLLFKEGAVRGLEALLAEPQQEIEAVLSDGEVIRWTKLFMVFRHPVLIFITEKHGNYFVYVHMVNSHTLSKYTLLRGQEEKSVIQSFTASVDRKFISVMSLSSDGCVYETLIPVYPTDPEENQRVVSSLLLRAVVSGSAPSGVALTVLDRDHVAVLGSPLSASKGIQVMPPFVNWEASQGDGLGSQHAEQPRRILRRRKIEVSSQPAVPPSKQLLTTIMKDSEKHIEMELRKFLAVKTPDFHAIVGDLVTGLLGRCQVEPSFCPRNCLVQLIQTHVLSYSLCPGLMEMAVKKTDVQLLQLCLQRFPDIPESVTCACLKIFLSIGDDSLHQAEIDMESVFDYGDSVQGDNVAAPVDVLQNGFSPEGDTCLSCCQEVPAKPQDAAAATPTCPVTPQRAALLNAILHSGYSEAFLLPHLKDIPAQHITLFLKYLYFLYLKCSENATMTLPGIHPPTLNQILDWICLLLDANFTVVVMIPEAKRLLISLYKFVKSQISVYSELNKIEVSFRELQKLNQEKNNRGLYSIEVLELF
ncbi:nucleolar protein 11 isoform X4 [Carlito syrichta]|uniref:Nucleolar protein 11 isoform X4 n=1 Tax=Carlito syrichta TaxID=1868482 RepID=A0A3Q0DQR2_CARSF|nr:nucleolar protein 11 isoform X4 [Carlito syrichta]